MIRRALSLAFVAWFLGMFWFAVFLPGPAGKEKTDAVVVLTGGSGRFDQAMDALKAGHARRMLVSGVDPTVRRAELEEAQHIPRKLSRCCIDLDKASVDTISNARESARWLKGHGFRSVRLVTSDWHMRRAELELIHAVGRGGGPIWRTGAHQFGIGENLGQDDRGHHLIGMKPAGMGDKP